MALKKPGKAPNAGLPQVRKSALKVPSVRKDAPTSKQASTEQPAGKLKAEVLKRATAANATAGTSQKESQPKVGKKTKPEERTEKKTKPKERTEKKTKSEERGAKKTKPEERTEKKVTPEGRTEKKKPEERNETDRKKAQADDQKRLPADGNKKEGKKEADPKKAPKKGKEKVEEKKPARKAEVVEAECAPGTSSSSFSKKPRVEKHEGRKAEQTEKLKTLAAQLEKSSKPTVKAPTTPPTKRFRMKSPASSVTTDASSARYKTSSNKEKAEAAMAKKLKGSLEQCVKEAEARAEEDSQQMLMLLDEICGEADKENTAPACNEEEASMDEAASDPPDSDDEDQEEEENQKKQEAGQGEADLEEQEEEEEEEEADTEAEEEEAEEQVDGEGDKSETGGDESQEEEESEEESEEDDKESDKDTGSNDTEMTGDQKEGKEKGTELVEAVKNTQRNSSFAEHVSAPQFIGRPSFQYPSISCTYNQVP